MNIIGRTIHLNQDDSDAAYYCIPVTSELVHRIRALQDICQHNSHLVDSVSCYAGTFGVTFFDQEEKNAPPPQQDTVWQFDSLDVYGITVPTKDERCRTSVDELHVTTDTFCFSSHPRNSHDVWETDDILIAELLKRWKPIHE